MNDTLIFEIALGALAGCGGFFVLALLTYLSGVAIRLGLEAWDDAKESLGRHKGRAIARKAGSIRIVWRNRLIPDYVVGLSDEPVVVEIVARMRDLRSADETASGREADERADGFVVAQYQISGEKLEATKLPRWNDGWKPVDGDIIVEPVYDRGLGLVVLVEQPARDESNFAHHEIVTASVGDFDQERMRDALSPANDGPNANDCPASVSGCEPCRASGADDRRDNGGDDGFHAAQS